MLVGNARAKTARLFARSLSSTMANQRAIIGCSVYVSDGSDGFVQNLKEECKDLTNVKVVTTFVDGPYNRSSLTLVELESEKQAMLPTAIHRIAKHVISSLDLRKHTASHPRLGVMDHISLFQLGRASAEGTTAVGRQVTAALQELRFPVLCYGRLDPKDRSLASIRRELGYFKPTEGVTWNAELKMSPSASDQAPDPALGICAVGICNRVTNFNVPLDLKPTDENMKIARKLQRQISSRYGGLPMVEAMALAHGSHIEVACNLLDAAVTSPEKVQSRLMELAPFVKQGYVIGLTTEELYNQSVALLQ